MSPALQWNYKLRSNNSVGKLNMKIIIFKQVTFVQSFFLFGAKCSCQFVGTQSFLESISRLFPIIWLIPFTLCDMWKCFKFWTCALTFFRLNCVCDHLPFEICKSMRSNCFDIFGRSSFSKVSQYKGFNKNFCFKQRANFLEHFPQLSHLLLNSVEKIVKAIYSNECDLSLFWLVNKPNW